MSNATNLMKQIAEVLAGYDAKVIESLIASIPARREAVAAVRARREAGEFKGQYATTQYAYAQIEAAGGKGWLELLRNGDAYITEHLKKTEAMKAEARNEKIAAKLAKEGVGEVVGFDSARTENNFEGRWTVETDKGRKSVRIEVIGAGGYNIQCYHFRVLVKVW